MRFSRKLSREIYFCRWGFGLDFRGEVLAITLGGVLVCGWGVGSFGDRCGGFGGNVVHFEGFFDAGAA